MAPAISSWDEANLEWVELCACRYFVVPNINDICNPIPVEREQPLHEFFLFPDRPSVDHA